MRIVFLALAFPRIEKTQYLYTDLVVQLHNHGHEVLVVAPANKEDHKGLVVEAGINVLRVATMDLFRVGLIRKGIANLLLPYQYKTALKKFKIDLNFDLIITPTPPITLFSLVHWLKKKSNAKVYLILRDIFPQNAVDLGFMRKGGIIHSYFRKKEKQLYAISDRIGCMSQGNKAYVIKHNPLLNPSKLHLLPNWANLLPLQTEEENEVLKQQEGLANKFIVIFGGNIGKPQKLENIVDLAIACRDKKNILFLIIGYGNEFEPLKNLIQEKNVNNIQLRDGVSHSEYFKLLQIADVGLISLNEKFTIPNTPSKVLSYYNAKKPVLASIDLNTDFGTDLEKNNAGLWAEAGKTAQLKEKLMILYQNEELRRQMGESGYTYMKKELSSQKAYDTIMNEVNNS
ncbi:glycosyltransferase family 4 protein [Arenibacter amylolyticus]|uniref:glycosyltransferase family 4 protein n=1 Tax=Arenibacter amylolyticus TaxID=1406873 RepID=UPI000A35E851|nr:glycosyltransferase family 4 protein [Arenibacter amylolyticus]